MKSATKVLLRFLKEGELVRDEEGLRVKTPLGEVAYARVMGRVVDIFVREDGGYGALTLDDETATLQVRFFRGDVDLIKKVSLGVLVDLIGRLREFQGRRYLVAEGFSVREDLNWELLRKLELAESLARDIKQEILDFIRQRGGALMVEIREKWGEDSQIVKDLKNDGEIYEPSPGVIKAVE
ncbi:MAG TPA: hypothetical protein ENN60_02185 [archaeon]|nr:hypothetical protein [archaeon]